MTLMQPLAVTSPQAAYAVMQSGVYERSVAMSAIKFAASIAVVYALAQIALRLTGCL